MKPDPDLIAHILSIYSKGIQHLKKDLLQILQKQGCTALQAYNLLQVADETVSKSIVLVPAEEVPADVTPVVADEDEDEEEVDAHTFFTNLGPTEIQ